MPPAVRVDGASEAIDGAAWSVTVNFTTADPTSPFDESVTVTELVPGLVRSEAGMVAVNDEVET